MAKLIEKNALRIQRSVYFYEKVTKKEVISLVKNILKILDEKEDDLRIYTIKHKGIALAGAVDLKNPLIFKE